MCHKKEKELQDVGNLTAQKGYTIQPKTQLYCITLITKSQGDTKMNNYDCLYGDDCFDQQEEQLMEELETDYYDSLYDEYKIARVFGL